MFCPFAIDENRKHWWKVGCVLYIVVYRISGIYFKGLSSSGKSPTVGFGRCDVIELRQHFLRALD